MPTITKQHSRDDWTWYDNWATNQAKKTAATIIAGVATGLTPFLTLKAKNAIKQRLT